MPINIGRNCDLLGVVWIIFSYRQILGAFADTTNISSIPDTSSISKGTNIARPGCSQQCGNLKVPFPFGIGSGCGIHKKYEFDCNVAFEPPRAFFGEIQILEISDNQMRISNAVASACSNKTSNVTEVGAPMSMTPYRYSDLNKFTVVGCNNFAFMTGENGRNFRTGCVTHCSKTDEIISGDCMGMGCCQMSVPYGFQNYNITVLGFEAEVNEISDSLCGYAFLADPMHFKFKGTLDNSDPNFKERVTLSVPVVLNWAIGNVTCAEAMGLRDYACKRNSYCANTDIRLGGYRCACNKGYEGNPYLDLGCTDIDECADPIAHDCANKCINTPGSFRCSCPAGYVGDGRKGRKGCAARYLTFPLIKVASGIGFGVLALIIAVVWLCFSSKKRRIIKLRAQLFRQNGGLLLKQQLYSSEGPESTKIFTAVELEKATDNYAEAKILGKGGFGTVYEGILPDKRIVAIKKSKVMNKSQMEQFINEVVILTQVNHRNVVRLLGCCLEYQVPLLVYEYVSNGTLFEHIHNKGSFNRYLSWNDRLRIASESASALSYLHSAASTPVIHRDVKSTNILLDQHHVAKISDFGASRLISLDQTEVTTMVQGTLGYLDPEYFLTSKLTEKSDVYSFGVVLAELMTGRKPIDMERSQAERNLATCFIMSMKENQHRRILDSNVLREGSLEQLQVVAKLTKRCLHLKGEDRPTMKEVAMELESYRKVSSHPWTQQVLDESMGLMNETESVDLYPVPTKLICTPDDDW